ncbi:MAG: peptidoglycan-binding protein [Clostridia bacterium]|nr:peptidoglycan-binding protein [Clostridia bacterium]
MKKLFTTLVCALLLLSLVVSASAASMLQKGDRGPAVKALQEALVNGGWADLVCDGVFGAKTEAAVKYYQQQNGLKATGRAGSSMLSTLLGTPEVDLNTEGNNSPTSGSSGPEVYKIQSRLKELGYNCGPLDGKFGKKTLAAVRSFQQLNGLPVDGKVGPKTSAVLFSESAVAYHKTVTYTKLRRGDSGAQVKKLQQALAAEGLYTGEITGYFNYATYTAVCDFQNIHGLKVDGIAGQQTLSTLYGTP